MELLQLRYFCDAAKQENFSKTARKYTVPPSNISQTIRRLETELGTPLFTRNTNKVTLNRKGEVFYKKISKALELIDDAEAELCDNGETGNISISVNTNRRIVLEAIEAFRKKFPDVNIKTAYFGNLETEEYNIIVDSENTSLSGYRKEILFSEDIALAVNRESRFATLENINVEDLRDEPFISLDSKASMCKVTKDICRAHGFEPRIAPQSDDPAFVRKCVELGLGIAFAPMMSWKGQLSENVVTKPLGYKREIYIYINESIHLPLCAKNFIDLLFSML